MVVDSEVAVEASVETAEEAAVASVIEVAEVASVTEVAEVVSVTEVAEVVSVAVELAVAASRTVAVEVVEAVAALA